jgi:hypothetical protein
VAIIKRNAVSEKGGSHVTYVRKIIFSSRLAAANLPRFAVLQVQCHKAPKI